MKPYLWSVVVVVVAASWISSAFGISVEIYPPHPMVNETVILNVIGLPGTFKNIDWYKGEGTNAANQILKIDNIQKVTTDGPQIFPEATLFPNGSLQLKNVHEAHEGYYTVSVQADQLLQATTNLTLSDSFQEFTYVKSSALLGFGLGLLTSCCTGR